MTRQKRDSALHLACAHGFLETTRVLVERGADMSLQNKVWKKGVTMDPQDGRTPREVIGRDDAVDELNRRLIVIEL